MEFVPQLLLLLVFIAFNGFFVASEISLVRVRRTRIDLLAKKKPAALLVQSALNNPPGFLSATQLGITISSLALGWIGEPIVAHLIEKYFTFLPHNILFISSHAIAITIGFILITFFQIVLGELIPKNIALQKAEAISLLNIGPLMFFLTIFKPFIWLLSGTATMALRILRVVPSTKPALSREEIKIVLAQSAASGALDDQEVSMIYKIFHYSVATAQSLMVPVSAVIGLNEYISIGEAIQKINTKYVHSRIPVYEYSINNVVGFVHVVDMHKALLAKKQSETLASLGIIRNIISVESKMPIDEVLLMMKKTQSHIAVVKDGKGKTIGMISIEDIIQNLVSDIKTSK